MHPYRLNSYKLNQQNNQQNKFANVAIIYHMRRRLRAPKDRRFWIRPWIERRIERGAYHNLVQELKLEAPEDFYGYLKMCPAMFQEILLRVSPRVTKVSMIFICYMMLHRMKIDEFVY